METITYTIEFNPQTGSIRPFEVWVTRQNGSKTFCSSSATLIGAEKSRKGYVAPRAHLFNVVAPEYVSLPCKA